MFLRRASSRPESFTRFKIFCRQASTLLLVEHNGEKPSPSTKNAVEAARRLGNDITALVCGSSCSAVAELTSLIPNINKVLYLDHPELIHHPPEHYSTVIYELFKKYSFSHLLGTSSSFGKDIIPRASALLSAQPLTDVVEIIDERTFKRPMYAGNALATLQYQDATTPRAITVRASSFSPSTSSSGEHRSVPAPVEQLPPADFIAEGAAPLTRRIGAEATRSDRPDLGQARVVVCGGRALQSRANFEALYQLAAAVGGAVGATRAAVDAGYVSNDLQIGQTGKVVAPDLYVGFGVSGAIQHLAGMKDSKVIVAVNMDTDAPIFQVADYGLKEDVFKAIPALTEEINRLPKATK